MRDLNRCRNLRVDVSIRLAGFTYCNVQIIHFNIHNLSLGVVLVFLIVLQLPKHVFVLVVPVLMIPLFRILESLVLALRPLLASTPLLYVFATNMPIS